MFNKFKKSRELKIEQKNNRLLELTSRVLKVLHGTCRNKRIS